MFGMIMQVNRLKIVNQEAVNTFAEHLTRIKTRVVESFEQFSQGRLDSTGLLDTLKDLGMEVNFSAEALDALPDIAGRPGLKYVIKPHLLLQQSRAVQAFTWCCRDTEPFEEQIRADFSKQVSPDQANSPACQAFNLCQQMCCNFVCMCTVASHF